MKNSKKSFILLTTMILVVLFSIYSLVIVENNIFLSNLNKLKYLHLQASIHIIDIKKQILLLDDNDTNQIILNDNRFNLDIYKSIKNNKTKYYITIETKDDTPIRLINTITK